jgi:hypothetical protein
MLQTVPTSVTELRRITPALLAYERVRCEKHKPLCMVQVVALSLEVNLRKIWDFGERNCCEDLRSHKIADSLFWNNDVWVPKYIVFRWNILPSSSR